jgi:hypothetical protein
MATTSFRGRRPQYIESYARTVSAYQRFQDISQDIQAEQDRLNYLDSLMASERQNLTNLNEVFRVRPQDLGAAQALLQQQYAGEDAARRRIAAGRAGRAADLQLPRGQVAELRRLLTGPSRQPASARDAALRIVTPDTTPEQAAELLGLLEELQLDPQAIQQVRNQVTRVSRGTARTGAPRAASPEERAAEDAIQQQLEAAFFAGPAGIRGGYDGQAIVERREQTAAPEGLSFSTEADAFAAALAAMQDGTLSAEDFASEEDFRFAKALYDEAKAKKAYRNDERVNFEPEVLASRARVAELQQLRAEAPGAQYTDPTRERFKRELIARGYDPDKNNGRYLQYQQSPYYGAMIAADDILDSLLADDVELEAVNRGQRMAADLVRQLDAAGKPYDIRKVEKQLGKVLEGEELQGALAFALATKEYDAQGMSSPNQRELQRAAKQREARAEEQARQLDAEITADIEAEAKAEFDFARRLKPTETKEEAFGQLLALQEPAAFPEPEPTPDQTPTPEPTVFRDPTDENFVYRRTADGFQVFEKGRKPYTVPAGSRPARSIEQVLAGGAALPPLQPAPALPAAPAAAPAPVDSAEALAAYEPPGMEAPAGEVEAAAEQVFVFDPKTGKLVPR